MQNNYTIYHLHSDLSLLDSVTKYKQYIDRAKECGMKAMAFSEHGHVFEYYHKKMAIEAAGMKYIHAAEVYVTESLDPKVRDNYHCVLISANLQGFYELNKIISHSYNRSNVKIVEEDDRYYYAPRVLFSDILNTSDNIIICTACIAGILSKGNPKIQEQFIKFLEKNKHRCFLEYQHHNVPIQKEYNQKLLSLHQEIGIPTICGTDTHALNDIHVKGRSMLQKSKGIIYEDEVGWDLTFKTYDELVACYKKQNALPMDEVLKAIENTNVLADMVEPFELDTNTKYPHIYNDSIKTFKDKINSAYKNHPYIRQRYSKEEIKETVKRELDTYIKTNSIDFMLLQNYLREWERKNGILCGYGRGSVSGSEIAYILGITQMDSKKFGLNFFRFLNPSRVTNADIDTDYGGSDRDKVKEFLLKDHMDLEQIQCSEIITFNTIALKGAIRDTCRGLFCEEKDKEYLKIADYICNNVEQDEEKMREEYPEVFEYVDILNGVNVSIGSHPSGVLVTDRNLAEQIGLCSLSTSNYPVSMLNMKELDALMYVKLDILGLDNINVINDTCKMLGIERLNPDNVNLEDEAVWKSIRDDTTLCFQWESVSAQAYLKKFMSDKTLEIAKKINPNFSYIKWFSFGNGLIRPGCASFRDEVAEGKVLITGFKELDEFLSVTMGRITMQEDIMQFLVKFCGYSDAESDTVRRGIAKKYGTEKFIGEITERFIKYSHEHYHVDEDKLKEIIQPINQAIIDASSYAFSWNHSDSYSCVGYICGYLRFYHPVEFLTAAFNTFQDDNEKLLSITTYTKEHNISIMPIKFRTSSAEYTCHDHKIYKGISSIKYMNVKIAEELYALRDKNYCGNFVELLPDLKEKTSIDSRQLNILIKLDYFSEFGEPNELLKIVEIFNEYYGVKQLKKEKITDNIQLFEIYSQKHTEKILFYDNTLPLIQALINECDMPKTTIFDHINYELECLGYVQITIPKASEDAYIVTGMKGQQSRVVTLYQLKSGTTTTAKVRKKLYETNPFEIGDIIHIKEWAEDFKWHKVITDKGKEKWEQLPDKELLVTRYSLISKE